MVVKVYDLRREMYTLKLSLLKAPALLKIYEINPNRPQSNKSNYIIERGLIWERNHCLGSDPLVGAICRWTVHCSVGGP